MEDTLTRVRLLKDYGGKKAGKVYDVEGDVDDLLDEGIAEIYDEEQERKEKEEKERSEREEAERFTAIARVALKEVLAENKDSKDTPLISDMKTGAERAHEKGESGFKSLAEHMQAVHKACPQVGGGRTIDERLLKVAGHMEEGIDDEGGYTVPTEFLAQLFQYDEFTSDVVKRCTTIPMQTNRIQIPALNQTSRADGSRYGGLTVYWTPEAGAKTNSKPTFRQMTLSLNKLAGLVHVSDELLADSPISIGPLVSKLFKREMEFVKEQAVVDGTGVGQPLGFMNGASLITQGTEAGQAANTIVFMNIARMWSRMWPPSQKNSVWLVAPDALPELYNIGLAVGTGGGPAYLPSGGLSVSPYTTLMGRPVIPCEHCQTLGTTGDIALCDFSQYYLGQKTGAIETAVSMHYRFIYDEQSFRFVLRVDGQPAWHQAITPKHGSNTMSPFVVLATRT